MEATGGRRGGNWAEGQRFTESSQAVCEVNLHGKEAGNKKNKKKRGGMAPLPTSAALPPLMLILWKLFSSKD